MPVPESVECCGLVLVLSKIVTEALCVPIALGVNASPSVQVVLGATVMGIGPQFPVLFIAYSAGSDEIAPEMISGFVAPVLLTVRFFVTVSPTATLPNASDDVSDIVVVGVAVAVGVAVTVEVVVAVEVASE